MRVAPALTAVMVACLMAAPAGAETIYVTNELDNTVTVIDGGGLDVTATIPVGRRPRGIALSPDGKSLYVAVGDDNRIDVVDLASRKVTGALPSGEAPENFVVHPDGKRLFVANENDNLVSVVDVATRAVTGEVEVGIEPEGMGVSPDGRLVVNTSETTSMLHVIDAGSLELLDSILVDTRPRMAQVSPDGARIWVSSELRGTVTVLDARTRAEVGQVRFAVPGVPRELIQAVGIRLAKDGSAAYVALGPANRVAEVDPKTLAVRRYYLVGQRVWQLAFSPDERRLYTANGNSGDVSVIDLAGHEVVRSVPVGRSPWGVAVAP